MAGLSESVWQRLVVEITRIVEGEGAEVWDIEYTPERGSMVLRIFIDKPDMVTVDDCANVSNLVSMMLDVEDLISGKYTLEVSSPGINRKLIKPEHFQRYLGRKIKVKLNPNKAGRKKFQGLLERYEDGTVVITDDDENQAHEIAHEDIHIARLVIDL